MAWWQKRLLRYALSRTGLLDDTALDPEKLDIALGKKNVIELKDVGLNIKRISKLAQLPAGLRIETARVLSLRLTVPADIYQSSIVAEVDGVELSLRLEESEDVSTLRENKDRARSPVTARSPPHRKVHRRLPSPPPYDPGGLSDSDKAYIPTTAELAKSFLQDESAQERRDLEASVAAVSKGMEESVASETSGDVGTGASIGLPGFLAGFLEGVVDRLQVTVKNVEAKVHVELPGNGERTVPVTLRLHVGEVQLQTAGFDDSAVQSDGRTTAVRRNVNLSNISFDLLSDADVFSELSELPSRDSPSQSRQQEIHSPGLTSSVSDPTSPIIGRSQSSASAPGSKSSSSPKNVQAMRASILSEDSDRFADAGEEENTHPLESSQSELDIQPGDDNISWGSRRSKSSAPSEDLWRSMASEDDLPDSLLLERAPTPRARSSRRHSPNLSRTYRDQSPLSQAMQSPGSWPRIEESPPRHFYPQSPGSWPLEQSRQSMFQSFTVQPILPYEDTTDNKRAALEASATNLVGNDISPEPQTPEVEDLTVSKVFSHEEAESMYMSAMTHTQQMHVPGGWSDSSPSETSLPSLREVKHPLPQPSLSSTVDEAADDDLAYGDGPYSTPDGPHSEPSTPRPQSPIPVSTPLHGKEKVNASKQLLHISSASFWLPVRHTPPLDTKLQSAGTTSASASFHPQGMPGTFSAYSDMTASRHQGMSFSKPSESFYSAKGENAQGLPASESLSIEIAVMTCQVDIPSGRLLYLLVSKAMPIAQGMRGDGASSPPSITQRQSTTTAIDLSIKQFSLVFRDSIGTHTVLGKSDAIKLDETVTLECQDIDVNKAPGESVFRCGSFRTLIGSSCLVAFDRSRDIKTSTIMTDQTPDIVLVIATKSGINRRSITELSLETLPLALSVDLPIIDETFSSFGGLSGVLEIGNSILSESGIGSTESSPLKPNKGVRFEGEPQYITDQPELKVNARFGGLIATLQGSACSIKLQTSTVKTVYRPAGAVATVEHLRLSGPHFSEKHSEVATVELTTMRLEYLFSPQDRDLERLLSLLTPSKDKYDNDDDILIDTLLRQRRKGAVARISVTSVKLVCYDLASLSMLSTFGDELGKLSVVTKYLPDDERPGLLSLVRIKDVEARVAVNERFGALQAELSDLHCAHVGLPALLALSVGNIKALQSGERELLHPLIPLSGSENLPMVMARMLGDEFEPTIKVKLFNVCAEYSVPVILALTGMDEAQTHDIVAEVSRSVADIVLPSSLRNEKAAVSLANSSSTPEKKLNVELLIHDSAIGLTPQNLPSKALLVLSDTSLSSKVPTEQLLQASADIRKAGLFVADQITDAADDGTPNLRSAPSNSATKSKLTAALSNQGFVSVGSIMAAKISVKIVDTIVPGSKSIDVEVRNKLLLLETCADSTQTLIAILNGLTPPTPPSKQPQYLTEPMTIEDMVASFSGDAFPKPEKPPETLFDVEEEPEDDSDQTLDLPTLSEDDDGLLAESTITSSLYGPIGSLMDRDDNGEDDGSDGPGPGTVESFLEEEDPFEMTMAPTDVPLSDSGLVRDLSKQCSPPTSDATVDLGSYEIEDLGFDALGGNNDILGAKHRFNTPEARLTRSPHQGLGVDLPFKLKLRDINIIWNIYDGYDWQRTRDDIIQAVEQVETRAEQRKTKRRQSHNDEDDEESVIGDFLFNSIYIGVPSNQDAQELRRQINRNIDDLASETESVPMSGMSRPTTFSTSGRPIKQRPRRRLKLERSRAHKVAFQLNDVSADIVVFPPDSTNVVSSVDLRVKDFEIFDNVPTSTWRKFLTHLDDPGSRELSKPMAHIELLNVRTLENFAASEIVLHVSILPLRLHVDQDALDFITRFFEFKDASMTPASEGSDQPFLQRVEIDTVDMCLDYKPKKVDYAGLRSGHTTEFMNFVILDAANIRLKHAIIYGIKGFEPLHKTLNDVWMPDIQRNQLPTVLAGLAPVRSLVNIGTGVRDVIAIPIREYQKDGRIVRSIQKGAFHFGKTTTSELARLGAKIALGTQTLLAGTEGFLTPASASPSGRPSIGRRRSSEQGWQDDGSEDEERETRALSAYANQPLGVFAGLRSARAHLEHDLLTARDALIAVQGEILESSGPGGAAAAVVKHAPTVILRPIIGTSRAVGTALLGVGNQIDRGNLRKVEDKYKRH